MFQIAAQRAEASYPPEVWRILTTQLRADAIYRELRRMDAEIVESATTMQPDGRAVKR